MTPENWQNIDEAVQTEWVDSSDGFERVQDVLLNTREPTSAPTVAERAVVSAPTARKHLTRLAELGVARVVETTNGRRYARNEGYHLSQRIQDLDREHTMADLEAAIEEMDARLETFEREYDTEHPQNVSVDVDEQEFSFGGEPTSTGEDVYQWQSTLQNRAVVMAAIEFKAARTISEPDIEPEAEA